MHKTTIHFIRHGEVHNPDQILYGRIPGFRLSETGRGQATSAGHALRERPIAALFASPQQRAQETATIISSANGREPVLTEHRLDEVYTPYEGRPLAELEKRMWDLYSGNQPPYETPTDIQKRVLAFVTEIRRDYAGKAVAAVTHGDNVLFMIYYANLIQADPLQRFDLAKLGISDIYPATASITSLIFTSDDPSEIPQFEYLRPY